MINLIILLWSYNRQTNCCMCRANSKGSICLLCKYADTVAEQYSYRNQVATGYKYNAPYSNSRIMNPMATSQSII